MIEDRLRDAFARHEAGVPAASPLVARINAAAKRRRQQRWLVRSAASGLAVILIAVAIPLVVRGRVPGLPLPLPGNLGVATLPDGPLNFLIVGLDRLPHQDSTKVKARADTVLIAHVPADRSGVQLVSIPRDLRVERADVAGQAATGNPFKLAELYAIGGLAPVEQSVRTLTGVTFAGTAVVELAGLKNLVDSMDGVTFCLDQPTTSIHTGQVYSVGCRRFSGTEMSDLLRQRESYAHAALDRDRHNAQFLAALIQQLVDSGDFTDIVRLGAAYDQLRGSVTVDARGLNVVDLAWALRGSLDSISYAGMQVVVDDRPGRSYVAPGTNAQSLFEALRTDDLPAWIAAHQHDKLFQEA